MFICLGKDWNDDHNDSIKGKRNVPSYILGNKLKIIMTNRCFDTSDRFCRSNKKTKLILTKKKITREEILGGLLIFTW